MPAPNIPEYTGDLPSTANPADFSSNAADILSFMVGLVPQLNSYGDYMDARDAGANLATYSGGPNTINLTTNGALTSIPNRLRLRFRASSTNTGPVTINVDGVGASATQRLDGQALNAGYIRTDIDTVIERIGSTWLVRRETEVITNANGTAWRLDRGLQLCYHSTYPGSIVAVGAGTPSDPWRSPTYDWTYPVSFSAVPIGLTFASLPAATNSGGQAVTSGFRARTATQMTVAQAIRLTDRADALDVRLDLIAIGSWL